jgi:hypothetical protein
MGLKDAKKVLRGTLRYKGFCAVVNEDSKFFEENYNCDMFYYDF